MKIKRKDKTYKAGAFLSNGTFEVVENNPTEEEIEADAAINAMVAFDYTTTDSYGHKHWLSKAFIDKHFDIIEENNHT